ncbi:MAG: DegT/DnrJ/EryC1/StrS family aminotransferase, partial [Chloroflexota bacterium]|nr:DegT/DnrJ/EryC1/StrS family aminotransferase [Chloroflexota bacterium]
SGTAALEIALRYFDLRGGEVIVPTNSFVASANSVIFAGGKPVLADIRADTLCLDPQDVARRLTPHTKGVMVVHLAGLPCPQMAELQELCRSNGLFLLEDAAQAHGAAMNGKKAGSLADAGCFSFYPTKVMTTAEGGMITTNNEGLARAARILRDHGRDGELHTRLGHNWRMSEVNAVLGLFQLRRLEEYLGQRERAAQRYRAGLQGMKALSPIPVPPGVRHSYYKFPVLLSGREDSFALEQRLRDEYHIATGKLYWPPIHLQPFYRNEFGYQEGMLPVSEEVLKRQFCLPMFVGLSNEALAYVLASLKKECR